MHVFDVTDDIEILRAFAWLHSNRRNLCLFAQNVRRSVAHNRDNNKQTNKQSHIWRPGEFPSPSARKANYPYIADTQGRERRTDVVSEICRLNIIVRIASKWSIVTCLIMHHTTYDTPYERYRSSWTSLLLLEAETSLLELYGWKRLGA